MRRQKTASNRKKASAEAWAGESPNTAEGRTVWECVREDGDSSGSDDASPSTGERNRA